MISTSPVHMREEKLGFLSFLLLEENATIIMMRVKRRIVDPASPRALLHLHMVFRHMKVDCTPSVLGDCKHYLITAAMHYDKHLCPGRDPTRRQVSQIPIPGRCPKGEWCNEEEVLSSANCSSTERQTAGIQLHTF